MTERTPESDSLRMHPGQGQLNKLALAVHATLEAEGFTDYVHGDGLGGFHVQVEKKFGCVSVNFVAGTDLQSDDLIQRTEGRMLRAYARKLRERNLDAKVTFSVVIVRPTPEVTESC